MIDSNKGGGDCGVSVTGRHRIDAPFCKDCGQEFPSVQQPASPADLHQKITGILDSTHCPKHGMEWEACCLSEVSIEIHNKVMHFIESLNSNPVSAGEHPEGCCHKCGRPNIVWFAPNGIWNKVVRDAGEKGILCPVCFVQLAEKAGFWGVWKVAPHDLLPNAPVVPSDDDRWVTFGRVKVDIENETETFERISPPQPCAAPKSEVAGGEEKLLPCPWCGVVPSVFDHSIAGVKDEWSVFCKGEWCAVAPSTAGEFKQHAVSQWNNQAIARRATPSPVDAPTPSEAAMSAAREIYNNVSDMFAMPVEPEPVVTQIVETIQRYVAGAGEKKG